MTHSVSRQVARGTTLIIEGPGVHAPIFAINWFNTRVSFVYTLYGLLVLGRVKASGGVPFFKATVTETLHGDETLRRENLLIVAYPSADRFLDLTQGRFFQMASVLRMATVQRFSFVMHRRLLGEPVVTRRAAFNRDHAFAVVHFETTNADWPTVVKDTLPSGITVLFAGQTSAQVSVQTEGKPIQQLRSATPNTLVLEGPSEEALRDALLGDALSELRDTWTRSYAAFLKRDI